MGSQSSRIAAPTQRVPDTQQSPQSETEGARARSPPEEDEEIVVKPRTRIPKSVTEFTPDTTAQEPSRKRRRTDTSLEEEKAGDSTKKAKVKDGKPKKARGRPRDPSLLKRERAVRPTGDDTVAEVVQTRDGGVHGEWLTRTKKAKRQSDVDDSGDAPGNDAVEGALREPDALESIPIESAAAENVPANAPLRKGKKRAGKPDDLAARENAPTEAATNGTSELSGDTDNMPEAAPEVQKNTENVDNEAANGDGDATRAVPAENALAGDVRCPDSADSPREPAPARKSKKRKKQRRLEVEGSDDAETSRAAPSEENKADVPETVGSPGIVEAGAEGQGQAQPEPVDGVSVAEPVEKVKRKRKSKVKIEPADEEHPVLDQRSPSQERPAAERCTKKRRAGPGEGELAYEPVAQDTIASASQDPIAMDVAAEELPVEKVKKRKRKMKTEPFDEGASGVGRLDPSRDGAADEKPVPETTAELTDPEATQEISAEDAVEGPAARDNAMRSASDDDNDKDTEKYESQSAEQPLRGRVVDVVMESYEAQASQTAAVKAAKADATEQPRAEEPASDAAPVEQVTKKRKRKPKKPGMETEDTAEEPTGLAQHPPPADETADDIHGNDLPGPREEAADTPSSEELPRPAAKKRKRKQAGAVDEIVPPDSHPDERRVSDVGRPGPSRRKRDSSVVPAPQAEFKNVSATAPAKHARLDPSDIVETTGIAKDEQSKPTHQSTHLPAREDKVEADVQWPYQHQDQSDVDRQTPSPRVDFRKVIGEIQWALDDISRVRSLSRKKDDNGSSPALREIRANVLDIGDHFHRHLSEDNDAHVRAWNIVCDKYMRQRPRVGRLGTGEGWRQQYLTWVKKGETAEEHRDRFNRALEMRNSYAQAPEDHRSRLEKIFTEELANGGERLLLGALLDAVPAGPQEMTPPGSPRMALEGFITEWIQDDVSMLDPNEPSARKPTGVFKGGGVDEEGDGEGVTGWEDDAQPNGAGGSPSPELRRQARRMSLDLHVNRPTRASLPDPVDNGPAAGAFTQIEKAATDDVLEYICQTYDLDSDEIRGNMIDWTNLLPELKVELKNALPNRTTAAIRKFCQRRYFPKTSGPWTKEEDEMLLRAHAEHGDRWMSVSDLVGGRTGQQCRDRYRDHLQYGEEKETGPWSQDEEAKLVRVVSECVEQIRQANIDKGDLVNEVEELEKLVAWNVVSDKFGGQRSRKRCMEKWQQLRRKNPDVLDALKDNHPPARVVTALPFDGHSRRQRKVVARYHSFQTGDIYDVLVEIYTAITDHAKIWSEETTFWSIVGQKNTGSRFNGALRRKAYQEALGTYEGKNAVRAAATIAGKAKAMAEWLELHREKHGAEFTRGYRPKPRVKKVELTKVEEGGNEGNGAPARMRQRARGRMNSARNVEEENCAEVEDALAREPRSVRLPKRKKVHLSAEMVENSDEEEDASDRKMGSDAGVEDEDAGGQDAPEPQSGGDASDEDVYNVPSDDPPAYDTVFKPEVPDETQGQPEVTGSAERTVDASDDALSMSSLNSRYRRNVSRPSLGRQEFLARCRETGRRQHAEALENGLGWARRGRG